MYNLKWICTTTDVVQHGLHYGDRSTIALRLYYDVLRIDLINLNTMNFTANYYLVSKEHYRVV